MQVIRPRYTALTPTSEKLTTDAQVVVFTDRPDVWRPTLTNKVDKFRLIALPNDEKLFGLKQKTHNFADDLALDDADVQVIVNFGDALTHSMMTKQVLQHWNEWCLTVVKWAYQRQHVTQFVCIAEQGNIFQPLLVGLLQSACLETTRLKFTEIRVNRQSNTASLSDCLTFDWLQQALHISINHAVYHQNSWHQRILSEQTAGLEPNAPAFSAEDVIVVLGGAGGVGLAVTEQLATRFGCTLVLIGRRGLDESLRIKLKASGAKSYVKADATDYQQLSDCFTQISNRFGQINAVLNLAGVLQDSLLVNLTAEQLHTVTSAKVLSAINLAHLHADFNSPKVINFSSYTSMIGNIGQSAYGAANYFLDEFSRQFDTWYSINWGLWESDGMQMPDGDSQLMPMPPAIATDIMCQLIAANMPNAAVIARQALSIQAPLASNAKNHTTTNTDFNQVGIEPSTCVEWLQSLVLGVTKFKRIDTSASLVDIGLDSVALINITARIEAELKAIQPSIKINKAIVFDQPSIDALSTWLSKEYPEVMGQLLGGATQAKPTASLASLSDAQKAPSTHQKPATLETLSTWLIPIAKKIGGLKQVQVDQNLLDLGFDSVMSIRLSADIERQLKQFNPSFPALSKAILFDYPSLLQLAKYLLTQVEQLQIAVEMPSPALADHSQTQVSTSPTSNKTPNRSISIETPTHSQLETSLPASQSTPEYRGDDIAILGMAGEFPQSKDKESFWANLAEGKDSVTEIPLQRWDWRQDYTSDLALNNRDEHSQGSFSRHGGFIDDVAGFDTRFFNIAPIEAESLDPQERRFLQIAYQALEDSGYFCDPHGDVAVYVAAMFGHYQALMTEQAAISSSFASIANRVSYQLDLHGPSVAVDSMCSGSMSALHFACNSLKLNECQIAIAGGVNLMTHPGKYRVLSQGKFVSPTGHCHAFGISADGYVPGEGVAAVVLSRYDTAQRLHKNGARIYAVIKATALNSGGKVSSFTVPSATAQQQVIEKAITASGVSPAQITYIEAHGTGTSLGDPIEITALRSVYSQIQDAPTCYLGAVKSNVGHLESCAAMAGLFKIVGQLQQQQLMPTLHASVVNPWLNIESTRFELVQHAAHWHRPQHSLRTAALSSFGAGGANGHAIIQEYPSHSQQSPNHVLEQVLDFPVSAHSKTALVKRVKQIDATLTDTQDISLTNLSFTLCCARQHFSLRVVFRAKNQQDLQRQCRHWLQQGELLNTDYPNDIQEYLSGKSIDFTAKFAPLLSSHSVQLITGLYYPFDSSFFWAEALLPEKIFKNTLTDNRTALMAPQWLKESSKDLTQQQSHWQQQLNDSKANVLVLIDENQDSNWIAEIDTALPPEQQFVALSARDVTPEMMGKLSEIANAPLIVIAHAINWPFSALLTLMQALHKHKAHVSIVAINWINSVASLHGKSAIFRGLAQENHHITAQHISLSEGIAINNVMTASILDKALSGLQATSDYKQWLLKENSPQQLDCFRREQLPVTLQRGQQRFRNQGVYMITGGLGMIGRAIAKLLIDRYQARVILVGRSALNTQKSKQLKALGEQAFYYPVDITDKADCVSVVAQIVNTHGELHGVIQSAGILRDALVQNKTVNDLESVWSVKAQGTINLDKATAHLPLDFFCVFSSMASQLGNVGQCDYIAANHFLDLFAQRRNEKRQLHRRQGHTLSINWPLWLDENQGEQSEAGYNDNYGALASFFEQEMGIVPLTQRIGAQLFVDWVNGVSDTQHQIMGFTGDVEKIYRVLVPEQHQPKQVTNSLHQQKPSTSVNSSQGNESITAPVVQNLTKEKIIAGLIDAVQQQTQLSVDDIAEEVSWGDLGFNSVMMQTFASNMLDTFGVNVPPTALFSYGNIEQLAEYLAKQTATAIPASELSASPQKSDASNDNRCAIIGIDGRLPGGEDLDEFWQGLVENRSAIGPVERWESNDYYAGTISNIEMFDAKFFGMSAREAMLMDPQHRLFLQTSYNAILDAGYAPESIQNVGIFAGVQFNDYQTLLQIWGQSSHPYAATGNAHAMLANRVSYLLNFNGPSQTVDTACSSALVALNRGVLSLQRGECDVALVGAVSLLIDPAISDAAQSMGVLSPDYRCATFDDAANGYVRAEGVGCLLIKSLSQAQQDNDSIYAIIEASVENHGGKANSLTSPNPNAQRALLSRAYTAELASRVSYIETHGTGTELGDPIEIDALKQAFQQLAPEKAPHSIALGAVKTNVGHLEPAAAIASLMKMIYAFKNQQLPANINFNAQNPLIDLQNSPFRLLTENESWESSHPRVAGVSSFGFGGSNAHAVLSEPPKPRLKRNKSADAGYLVTLSARSLFSLKAMSKQLLKALQDRKDVELGDLAFTLATGRSQFEYRLCWIAESLHDLKMQIQSVDFSTVTRLKIDKKLTSIQNSNETNTEQYLQQLEMLRDDFLSGKTLDWATFYTGGNYSRLHLPGYVFDCKRFWFEQAADSERMKEINHGNA